VSELTWIVDPSTGDLLVEGLNPEEVPTLTSDLLPSARDFGCARPLTVLSAPMASPEEIARSACVRIAGYYHNSLTEGPGRRTSVLFQSCPLRCTGCWVPHLHSPDAGSLIPVDKLANALLDPAFDREGVSILGGEPFVQLDGLLALVRALRSRGCSHILCYSGYTYEVLCKRARRRMTIGAILDDIDVLVDGPYIEARVHDAGPWTGSANQRVIDLAATRQAGRVILLAEIGPCPSSA
jgi:anaerobic ribonucleoside-triphosphate reductase activating protein